jgi:RHS repeat-associated protein
LFSGHSSSQVLEIRQDQEPNAYEQYVWGANYIDAAVVRWHDGNLDGDLNDQGDNTLYYTYDGNFNVTALVEPDGDVVERYDYDPYGNGPGWGSYSNEILFCGYRRAEGGLYYVRNRYYHPRLGRWMSREPMIFPWNRCILSTRLGGLVETIRGLGGGAWGANLLLTLAPYFDGQNCYGYTRSNPNDFFDPSGCWTWHGVWEWIDLHIVTPISYLVPGSELVQAAKCAPGVGAIDAYAAMQKRALECQANGIDFDADPEYQRLRRLTLKAGEAAAKECCRK